MIPTLPSEIWIRAKQPFPAASEATAGKKLSSDLSGSGSPISEAGSPTATNAEPLEEGEVNEEHDQDSVLTSAQDPAAPQS
jgi:hypothetical protein